jgi:hypothetical protein
MVDVPFVSEDFQRAFRNTFQGQVNSGRDLHVSDVVIPVVDFTPTASGTSLPTNLAQALNLNTTNRSDTGTGTIGDRLINAQGFFEVNSNVVMTGLTIYKLILINQLTAGETNILRHQGITSNTIAFKDNFIVYIPVSHHLKIQVNVTDGEYSIDNNATLLADVNGNLVLPANYDPQ